MTDLCREILAWMEENFKGESPSFGEIHIKAVFHFGRIRKIEGYKCEKMKEKKYGKA